MGKNTCIEMVLNGLLEANITLFSLQMLDKEILDKTGNAARYLQQAIDELASIDFDEGGKEND